MEEQTFPHSSTLHYGTYNTDTQFLTMQFKSGANYGYEGVPENVWRELRRRANPPPSAGSYFHYHVKVPGYKYYPLN